MYKEKLKKACIGIAGCGGLGSNCAVALARIGVGKLILADFDIVTESNLNRQYFFLEQLGQKKVLALRDTIQRINVNVNVHAFDLKLSPDSIKKIFYECDIIVEAFDMDVMKQMLIETIFTEFPEKYIVAGSGLAGWGNNNAIKTVQHDKLYICGDQISEVNEMNPPLAPKVAIVANMQANQVFEIIMNQLN